MGKRVRVRPHKRGWPLERKSSPIYVVGHTRGWPHTGRSSGSSAPRPQSREVKASPQATRKWADREHGIVTAKKWPDGRIELEHQRVGHKYKGPPKDKSESDTYFIHTRHWEGGGRERVYVTIEGPNGKKVDMGYLAVKQVKGDEDSISDYKHIERDTVNWVKDHRQTVINAAKSKSIHSKKEVADPFPEYAKGYQRYTKRMKRQGLEPRSRGLFDKARVQGKSAQEITQEDIKA